MMMLLCTQSDKGIFFDHSRSNDLLFHQLGLVQNLQCVVSLITLIDDIYDLLACETMLCNKFGDKGIPSPKIPKQVPLPVQSRQGLVALALCSTYGCYDYC